MRLFTFLVAMFIDPENFVSNNIVVLKNIDKKFERNFHVSLKKLRKFI